MKSNVWVQEAVKRVNENHSGSLTSFKFSEHEWEATNVDLRPPSHIPSPLSCFSHHQPLQMPRAAPGLADRSLLGRGLVTPSKLLSDSRMV